MTTPRGGAEALNLNNTRGFAAAERMIAVTPNDYSDLPDGPCDWLWCTANGNVRIRPHGGPNSGSILIAVLAGQRIPIRCKRVLATDTTGTVYAMYDRVGEDFVEDAAIGPILDGNPVGTPDETDGTKATLSQQLSIRGLDPVVLYAVVTELATPPSAAQIIAGNDQAGNPGVFADSVEFDDGADLIIEATGLTEDTAYYVHTLVVDSNDDQSAVGTSVLFTTADT